MDGAWVAKEALRPLSAMEMEEAVALVRAEPTYTPDARFVSVELEEPDKRRPHGDRRAVVEVYEPNARHFSRYVVSLRERRLVRLDDLAGSWPRIVARDFVACEAVVKQDPRFRAALARRGITDMDLVMVDPESVGHYGQAVTDERRLARGFVWVRKFPGDNGYAHPVDGLSVLVDLDALAVIDVEDTDLIPVPWSEANWSSRLIESEPPLHPLDITQPEGPGFTIDANQEVAWRRWRFQIGFTSREGLVLHRIRFLDQGRERPIVYRASLSEMAVPYGDPRSPQWWKNAFDAGEYGLGEMVNSLELGCDCLGEIRYLDVRTVDADGSVVTHPNGICIHEEDYGVLWKHTDWRTGESEVRRSRRLVVSMFCTVGNYDYGFFWYFYLDGSIQHEVKLTGIVSTAAGTDAPVYGQALGDGLYAPIHQHFFNVRLDFDIDGVDNAVYEVNTEPLAPGGDENPLRNGFRAVARLLRTEKAARRDVEPRQGRFWRVVNHAVTNAAGEPVGYRLVPGENVLSMPHPTSSVGERATFMAHHLWVTPESPAERYAAGEYPNQRAGKLGLMAWTEADRDIADRDLVVWYSFGAHHVVRLEDWPVMPVHYIGFMLKPDGFFAHNPALTLPPEHSPGHHEPHHRTGHPHAGDGSP